MKFKSYIIFFLLFGVVSDVYSCLWPLADAPWWGKALLCLPTLAAGLCLPLIGLGKHYTDAVRVFSYLTFIFALPKFVFTLFDAVGRFLFRSDAAATVALVAGAGVSLVFLVLIFYVTRHLVVQQKDLTFRDLPKAFEGFRVCHLSDLHLGSFGKVSSYIRRIMDAVESLRPDLILFTGDLVNFETAEALPFLDQLRRLRAPFGIFAIRGNHDYLLHGHHSEQDRQEDMDRLLRLEQQLGWHVLLNAHEKVRKDGDELAIVGVENVSANPYFTHTGGDLQKALKGLPDKMFRILLSHDPSHWRSEVVPAAGIPLTLSGHTHGLKYKLAGLHVSHWKLHESGGIYTAGDQTLYVSEGLGSAFAFRLGGYPKIDLLTLHCAEKTISKT